jgi:uncharacterized protein (DUF2252 family)
VRNATRERLSAPRAFEYRRDVARSTALVLLVLVGCAVPSLDDRERTLVSVMARTDEPLIRTRAGLVAGKYGLMHDGVYDYFRGSAAIYAHDFAYDDAALLSSSRFALTAPLVLANGDPHVENFGALIAADGTFAIEENDFDAADYYPYLYDLRRFLVGLVVATYASNEGDDAARQSAIDARRDIVRAAAAAYADAMAALASGAAAERLVTPPADDTILADVLARSEKDWAKRTELDSLTVVTNGTRALVRGVLDPTDPTNVLVDLPLFARDALPQTLEEYTKSLTSPPDAAYFTILDAARELGAGVASWPRVRAMVLVRGSTDDPSDDVVLEVKEEADSGARTYPPYVHFDSVQRRVTEASRAIWRGADRSPLWGASTWVGFPVQVRLETDGQKGVKTKRFVRDRGTAAALTALAGDLAALLARIHATPSRVESAPATAIAARIAMDPNGFADEQANVALVYGDRCVLDQSRFAHAVDVLGLRLGIPLEANDAPTADLAALYASP